MWAYNPNQTMLKIYEITRYLEINTNYDTLKTDTVHSPYRNCVPH